MCHALALGVGGSFGNTLFRIPRWENLIMATLEKPREEVMEPNGSGSHTNGSGLLRRFWSDKDKEEPKVDPSLPAKKTHSFMVADPRTGDEHRGLLHFVFDLIRGMGRWKKSLTLSDPVEEQVDPSHTWQALASVFFLKLLWVLNGPMKMAGRLLEDTLNFFMANDGVFKTIFRVVFHRHRLVIRKRDDENYCSFIGALDPRTALLSASSPSTKVKVDDNLLVFPGKEYGSKYTADVLVMASKLAYENAKFVERVVTNDWKMNFVGFYDCWNEFQKQKNTQVFLFTDRPQDARAIIVAFRGTEPFNAIDWSTDFDFSWFDINGLGKVHVGFLEALGLGDRRNMETFVSMYKRAHEQRKTSGSNEGSSMSGLSTEVKADEDKSLAYDHVTWKVKTLMRENPEAKLFITGHSLGGALANLYTALLFFNNEELLTKNFGAVYTFGQPRVGAADYSKYLISKVKESRYWRVVYGNDMIPRIPFDDKIFQFKHCGYCFYYDERYVQRTMEDAPNANYFSLKLSVIIGQRIGAVYDLIFSIIGGWIYGPEYREGYVSTFVRFFGIFTPGMCAHSLNNYVNAVRLGPTLLEAKLHEETSEGLYGLLLSFLGSRKEKYPTSTIYHEDLSRLTKNRKVAFSVSHVHRPWDRRSSACEQWNT
ncbi:hypothetical protein R1flu_000521 [Riccia fluitans]|uniref:Fungal lipase-type domain-containing protein n=1 Tax=Riccia fluitans TaxID=41844 RepID=A0ABD1Y0N8_9MARC